MSFKKMLGFIFIIFISVFSLMLTTSYAWYSFENASTKFDVVTANHMVDIVFQNGEYIDTNQGVPIKSSDVDRYSDKYDFNIKVKNQGVNDELVAKISLKDIVIDSELKKVDDVLGDSPFRMELFYQGNKVGNTVTGANFSSDSYDIGDVVLSNSIDNQFEFRVYLLDNGKEQSNLMNRSFQGRIDINVISRASVMNMKFDNPDILISDIVIDGKASKSLPISGMYSMTSSCKMGSHVSWDSLSKSLIYDKGSYVHDSCSLEFVSHSDKYYLKDVSVGSYVSYVGNNGCNGFSCQGESPNYVDNDNMGYCGDSKYHYSDKGWRVAYTLDNIVYLVSAGALECIDKDKKLDDIALKYCNSQFVYDEVCNGNTIYSLKYSDILRMDKFMVDNGGYYWVFNEDKYMMWNPVIRSFSDSGDSSYGVRVIVKMDQDILISGGSGSIDDPYTIYQ